MSPEETSGKSNRIILSAQYFLYFGVLGIFLPYFNLYCYHLEFTGFQIGVLSAVRSGATVIFPLLWGVLADRFQARKMIYVLFNFVSTAIWLLFVYTTDFWLMLAISFFYGIFYSPLISFLEAFAMDILGKEKKSYGKVRGWGTISFIIICFLIGRLIDVFSIEMILVLIFAGSLVQSAISIKIPDISMQRAKPGASVGMKHIKDRRIIIFLFCSFLMLTSHGAYYGFFTIHLENLGFNKTFVGISWALASIAEFIVMINSARLFKRFSLERVLVFSFVVSTLRWVIIAYVETAGLILASQLLHAVTYGAFHMAGILYIDRLFPEDAKTFGQAVNNAITFGLGITAGFMLGGLFFELKGSSFLFLVSAGISLFGGVILWGFYRFFGKE